MSSKFVPMTMTLWLSCPHRRGDSSAGHVEAAHERLADVAVFPVALDLGDVEDVLLDVAAHVPVDAVKLHLARLGDGNPRQRVHAQHLHLRRALGAAILKESGVTGLSRRVVLSRQGSCSAGS